MGSSSSCADRLREVTPRAAHEAGQRVGGRGVGGLEELRRACRLDEPVEQLQVVVAAIHVLERPTLDRALPAESRTNRLGGLPVQRIERDRRALEPACSITSASRTCTERVSEPLQVAAELLHPHVVEDRRERAEIGPQPTGADARLVHALGAAVEAHDRVVLEDADDRRGDRGASDLTDGRVRVDRRDDELGRRQRPRPERTHELRRRVGLPGAGGFAAAPRGREAGRRARAR